MSRYAITDAGELIVSWPTGAADQALVLTKLPGSDSEAAATLATAMTTLSARLWRTYTHPSSAVPEDGENSEHWRRERQRSSVETILEMLLSPDVPDDQGNLLISYDPVVEAANRVGRALLPFGDPALTQQIRDAVADEIASLHRAELDDLSGRAAQAVTLSRPEASPVQVAAAHDALARNPLGDAELFRNFEPTAAAVAAAHWLHAAAILSAELCGYDNPSDIIRDADDIEPLRVRTPMMVVNRMEEGQSAQSIVVELVREAQAAADGFVGDPTRLLTQIDQAMSDAATRAKSDAHANELRESLLGEARVCLLDPMRPAQDLLEDLLAGIYGCWLMYAESTDLDTEESAEEFIAELRIAAEDTLPD